jgi:hypothetical protein
MSWRIMFAPAYFNNDPGDQAGADLVVPQGATDADIDAAVVKWGWQLPLKIWTPSEDDPRVLRFVAVLTEQGMDENSYTVYVKPPMIAVTNPNGVKS